MLGGESQLLDLLLVEVRHHLRGGTRAAATSVFGAGSVKAAGRAEPRLGKGGGKQGRLGEAPKPAAGPQSRRAKACV